MTRDLRLLMFSLFVWGMGEGLTIYIRPLYLKELGADPVAIGAILSAAGMAAGITHIPAGYLADRLGRKPLLVAGWVLGTLTAAWMALARDLAWFVPGLLLYTLTGFVMAPINAYVSEARGTMSIQRALTLTSASFWAGNILSPAVGGLIGQTYGLRLVYGLAVILFILSTLTVLPLTAQPLRHAAPGTRRYGALFRNRPFQGFLGLMFFALLALELGIPLAPNFVVETRGLNVAQVGLLGTATSVGAVVLNVTLGQRAPRRGFMLAQGLLALYAALLLSGRQLGWLAAAFFFQGGWNLARNMASAQVRRVVSDAEVGLAFGIMETVVASALVLAPLAAGFLYRAEPALPFQVSLALILATLPLVWRLAPRRDAHSPEPAPAPKAAN